MTSKGFVINPDRKKYPSCPPHVWEEIKKRQSAQDLLKQHKGQDVYIDVCMTCGSFNKNRTQINSDSPGELKLAESKPCRGCQSLAAMLPFLPHLGRIIRFTVWQEVHRGEAATNAPSGESQAPHPEVEGAGA